MPPPAPAGASRENGKAGKGGTMTGARACWVRPPARRTGPSPRAPHGWFLNRKQQLAAASTTVEEERFSALTVGGGSGRGKALPVERSGFKPLNGCLGERPDPLGSFSSPRGQRRTVGWRAPTFRWATDCTRDGPGKARTA